MNKDYGGSAFPGKVCIGHSGEAPVYEHKCGMSLRDYFAAAALQGIMANPATTGDPDDLVPIVSALAYMLADSMLNMRDK